MNAASAQTLTKLYDFSAAIGVPSNPYDTPIVIGNELWFTTQNGGDNGFGTVAKFDLSTNTLTQVLGAMDNESGNTPTSSLAQFGNQLYYLTTRGGAGDKGTLNVYDLEKKTNTVLHNFGYGPTDPQTPAGGVTVIDRGDGGLDLYYMTTSGGTGNPDPTKTGYGTISKFNTKTGTTTVIHSFTGSPSGRQPFEGFTRVGNDLYFTTFTGGSISGTLEAPGANASNGVGTLAKLDITTDTYTLLTSMPTGDGSTFFPAHNPTYDAVRNALYFTTTGTSTQPGSIQKFDITTGVLSTLYELTGAATTAGPFPDGKLPYGSIALVGDQLFFTTKDGSVANSGTINMFDLRSNTLIKLFNLDASTGDNYGGEARGGFAVVADGTTTHLYLTTRQGGKADTGTILRLDIASIPEPGVGTLALIGIGSLLGHRRRRATAAANQSL